MVEIFFNRIRVFYCDFNYFVLSDKKFEFIWISKNY